MIVCATRLNQHKNCLPKQSFVNFCAEICDHAFDTTCTIVSARSDFNINNHIFHDFLNGSWLFDWTSSWRDAIFIVFDIKITVSIAICRTPMGIKRKSTRSKLFTMIIQKKKIRIFIQNQMIQFICRFQLTILSSLLRFVANYHNWMQNDST